MSDISIKIDNYRFWIPDSFIELLSEYICEAFEAEGLDTFSYNLLEIYEDCDNNRKGWYTGFQGILFKDTITSIEDKESIIAVFQKTKLRVEKLGDEITVDQLNEFENRKASDQFRSPYFSPVKTQSLVGTLNIMISMLDGTCEKTNFEVRYQGFGASKGATIV